MHLNKKIKLDKELNEYNLFYEWCESNQISINNAVILQSQKCSGNGLFAEKDFLIGDVIFTIPKSILFTHSSSEISNIVKKECKDVANKWIPLLINLIFEYCLKEQSKWFPYINLTINFEELDLPLFWNRNEREELLTCIGIIPLVENDINEIEKDFKEIIKPFISKYSEKFKGMNIDLLIYKKIVSFVMAYSFTLPEDKSQSPILVPLADILNHITYNNAKLIFGLDSLSMVAIKDIKKGDEIFNTYGEQSNANLLHMYGFAEDLSDGIYDNVEIPLSILYNQCVVKNNNIDLLHKNKINWFNQDDVILLLQHGIADKVFVINFLKKFLKYTSNSTKLNEDCKSEVSDDDSFNSEEINDDDNDDILTFDEISNLDLEFKEPLLKLIDHSIKQYPNSVSREQLIITSYKNTILNFHSNGFKLETEIPGGNGANNIFKSNLQMKRKFYAACVRKGQLSLLHKIKSALI